MIFNALFGITHTHTLVHSGADNLAIALHFLSLPLSTSPYLFLPLFSLLEDWTKNFSIWICSVVCYLSFCGSIHNNFVSGSTKLLYVFPQQLYCVGWWTGGVAIWASRNQDMRGSRANKQIKQVPFVEHLINQPVGVRENEKMSHKLMVLPLRLKIICTALFL